VGGPLYGGRAADLREPGRARRIAGGCQEVSTLIPEQRAAILNHQRVVGVPIGEIRLFSEFDKPPQLAYSQLSIRSDSGNRIWQPAVGDGKVP
jgi:hypothetical protein